MKRIFIEIVSFFISVIPKSILRSRTVFRLLERKGFHIVENHYYQPIPDSSDITDQIFNKKLTLEWIQINLEEQLNLLDGFVLNYKNEYTRFPLESNEKKLEFFLDNDSFVTVDAEILYCMIRELKPGNIIEIGSGMSTLLSAKAVRRNTEDDPDYKCNIKCIDPFPPKWLYEIEEVSEIVTSKVETLSVETFSILGKNDILFLDSSHIIKVYNDVCFEYLELLPSLKKGVFVHVHDIVLPQIYSNAWFPTFYWNEQYLLLAFMSFNKSFKVVWAGNLIHLNYPQKLKEAFSSYSWFKTNPDEKKRQQGHKSFWIQRIN